MRKIDHDSSCIAIGVNKAISEGELVAGVQNALALKDNDVVISTIAEENFNVYQNAKLYIDFVPKPQGVPIYCMICSVMIHNIIPDIEVFLKMLSKELLAEIFVDIKGEGYLVSANGAVNKIGYSFFFVEDVECLNLER